MSASTLPPAARPTPSTWPSGAAASRACIRGTSWLGTCKAPSTATRSASGATTARSTATRWGSPSRARSRETRWRERSTWASTVARVGRRSGGLVRRPEAALTTTRRTGVLVFLLGVSSLASAAPKYDLLLRGGHVIDPRNRLSALRDVAMVDGRIAAVAPRIDPAESLKTVDVTGLYV